MPAKTKEPKKVEVVETLPVPAYQVTINETGEMYALASRERFQALATVGEKAEAFAQLKRFYKTLGALVREIEVLMTASLHAARPDPNKVVNVPTSMPGVTVSLPAGLEDKTLNKGEVRAFADSLAEINVEAYKEIIDMEPIIKKAAVNKYRVMPGPVADLILRTYAPHPKSAEIKVKE